MIDREDTVFIKYICFVETHFDSKVVDLDDGVWPPQVTLENGETHECNVSEKLGEEMVTDILIGGSTPDPTPAETDSDLLSAAVKKIKYLEAELENAVVWGVEDFECQALELERRAGRLLYDRSKFAEALSRMIHKHDATLGITWSTVEIYLDANCKL